MVTSRAHMSLSNACKLWSGIGSDLNASRSYRASTIRLVLILEQQGHFVLARNERSVWFTSGWRQKVDAQQRTTIRKRERRNDCPKGVRPARCGSISVGSHPTKTSRHLGRRIWEIQHANWLKSKEAFGSGFSFGRLVVLNSETSRGSRQCSGTSWRAELRSAGLCWYANFNPATTRVREIQEV